MAESWQHAADRLAAQAIAEGRPTGWFEELYAAADSGAVSTPWDRDQPHPLLADWAGSSVMDGSSDTAVVVGCGLGADAEFVAGLGYATTAFDISATAVRTARARHPDSAVDYLVADLLDTPVRWRQSFDLVVDIFTVQALPPELHQRAAAAVADLVAPGGTLVAIGSGSAADAGSTPTDGPPFLLGNAEVDQFLASGLREVSRDRVDLDGFPRWRLVAEAGS